MDPNFTMKVAGTFIGVDGTRDSIPRDCLHVTLAGIKGDRHYGHSKRAGVRERKFHEKGTYIFNARQWSAVTVDELAAIARDLGVPEIKPEWLGANLLLDETDGCDFTSLPGLTRIVFEGGAVLLVYGENKPCQYPGEVMLAKEPEIFADKAKFFAKNAKGRRGLVGWAERAGDICPGEEVRIYLPGSHH